VPDPAVLPAVKGTVTTALAPPASVTPTGLGLPTDATAPVRVMINAQVEGVLGQVLVMVYVAVPVAFLATVTNFGLAPMVALLVQPPPSNWGRTSVGVDPSPEQAEMAASNTRAPPRPKARSIRQGIQYSPSGSEEAPAALAVRSNATKTMEGNE
jgi:hypothetical protein